MPQNPTPAAAGDTNPTTNLTPEIGPLEHLAFMSPDERFSTAWVWAKYAESAVNFTPADSFKGTLVHLQWAVAEIERLRAELDKVAAFAAQRAEYVTSILNCHPDNKHDYYRWQGHAESRRQLSERLGLPVAWPAETEPRTAPSQREAGAL
ncbi:hypothetical protein F2B00_03225 [Streptomyces parvus]|uniref:hypothetical protein n=1 Tax=Streptomyces parvus TaxID=66428 RepID=UPI00123B16F6|nr:hypothetical protein [Streptomyces parvus]KAA6203644.1 hypothetical protein F2B00_03225 [Streptomyces parvus]GGS41117.1 hypothetical protein GCM10010221_44840 [Streptomyces parvus]